MISGVMTTIDQVGTGVLTTAVGVLGSRLVVAANAPRGLRAKELSIARWFETYELTKRSLPELPGLSEELAPQLTGILSSDAVQATLQELLAARLTDADNIEANRARESFHLTIATADPALSSFGPPLAEYYDEQICSLVARLEADEPTLLAQIRSEALSARMIAIMRATERHIAALSGGPNRRTEESFLASYRDHVLNYHGKLEPPDFDRRRRVPISDIYVPPAIYKNADTASARHPSSAVSVWDLARLLDRTVLLGDPGGGKTTASNVLMHYFASESNRRIPFLVTLRNYAGPGRPGHSIAGYIESELKSFYQCPPPPGLVDMLLLTGRAVILFDGLDELLDTSHRSDVASRIEHFCREYPLAPVLVTSRLVGYSQARLDEASFVTYRLGGFRDEDVSEYARKWFNLEDSTQADEAETFLAESESVTDLRTNPLLLSLMCILYRGEGSLPHNRVEVYEQCAQLLFKKWDARRHIYQELRADRYVERILRHLAWLLFTRDDTKTSVSERELVASTGNFLHGNWFESMEDACEAAAEFVEFTCGRLWVFSDVGTTATGETLYSFTHRTFLEYFAACQLAYDCDTPEELAQMLAPHVARGEWEMVSELAVQIKDSTSAQGADRIYGVLLQEPATGEQENTLRFLARTLRSAPPSPKLTRILARKILNFIFSGDPDDERRYSPLSQMLGISEAVAGTVDEEISSFMAILMESSKPRDKLKFLRLTLWLDRQIPVNEFNAPKKLRDFWANRAREYHRLYDEALAGTVRAYRTPILLKRRRRI